MKNALLVLFLVSVLTACTPAITSAPTETILPMIVLSSTPIPTSTLIPATETPSPVPTDPIILMITPDSIQVERWREYQTALAKTIMSYELALCEWEVLGRSENEIYVWATCRILDNGSDSPAVIHLGVDGAIQKVEIPGTNWSSDIREMFPIEIQEIFLNNLMNYQQLSDHLTWRIEHPEESPLIVLSSTPAP
ncbi:MAG TPA: hypothetical protein PKN81_13045 [Anaerolineales bacterium]|nr:hypothetical protein [Anaerolineales bacterium]HNA52772.1 hypothetical protein [Anaerolineales bacterium]HNE67227.1 hypothetical protein [Anaerolineales bacterium]HNJ15299.1 hypothetical protein [Anaerolineales bacterium]HNO86157.1 hypothetical protein [Anaerolineales bacterium]